MTASPRPAVDLTRAMERVGGDRTLLGELVEIFLRDLPGRLQAMRRGLDGGNVSEVERISHSMKGSLATLGALEASALAAGLEVASREARLDAAAAALGALEAELARVQAFFDRPGWLDGAGGER